MKFAVEDFLVELDQHGVKLFNVGNDIEVEYPIDLIDPSVEQRLQENLPAIKEFLLSKRIPVEADAAKSLSFSQQRLWFIDQLGSGSTQYNLPIALKIQGDLNETCLQQAFDSIVARHSVLRTTFHKVEGKAFSRINDAISIPIERIDLDVSDQQRQAAIMDLAASEAEKPFDLGTDLMLRVVLVNGGVVDGLNEWILLITLHHIASDGWSLKVLIREFTTLYNALCRNEFAELPQLQFQYADYAAWQRQRMQGELLESQIGYWTQALAGIPPVHGLQLDRTRPAMQSFDGALFVQEFGRDVRQRLSDLARKTKSTLFVVLQTAFAVLLSRLSDRDDIVIGSPISGRTHEEFAPLVGFFVNTLVLRTQLKSDMPFESLLLQNRNSVLDAFENQDIPFEMLLDHLKPERSLSYSPLFQILFSVQNQAQDEDQLILEGMQVAELSSQFRQVKCDLEVAIVESPSGMVVKWMYATSLFDEATIRRMSQNFDALLESIVRAPEQSVGSLPLMPISEQEQLRKFNDTAIEFPVEDTIVSLFEKQVESHPDRIAIVFDDSQLTYGELNVRVNQLAHHLVEQYAIGDGTLVGLSISRSIEMMIGLLAILKAGGAYVPLDSSHPKERLEYMVQDSGIKLVLVDAQGIERLNTLSAACLSVGNAASFSHCSRENPIGRCTATSLAYAIYTSGSTGRPKGTLNLQRGVCNRLHTLQHQFKLLPDDKVLQKTPLSFDVSVWEMFWPLSVGSLLVLASPEGHKDPAYVAEAIRRHRITLIHFVPSMLQMFLKGGHIDGLDTLRYLMTSGEALSYELQSQSISAFPGVQMINHYGPTEAAIEVTYWSFNTPRADRVVPIGKPVANTQIYILDRNEQQVPIGIAGELHISGIQVGEGYLNQPELTAQKFVTREVAGIQRRMYKTGDLVRWLEDGNIEYIGRLDHQIKLRGMRVELGEIENIVRGTEGVEEAVVLVEGQNISQRLACYIVPVAQDGLGEEALLRQIRDNLARSLPAYMIPSDFVVIDKMPISVNGKIDFKALSSIDRRSRPEPIESPRPSSATEMALTAVWATQLNIPASEISVHSSFFELGGNSLSVISLQAAIKAEFNIDIPIASIFQHPTIFHLSQSINGQAKSRSGRSAELMNAKERVLRRKNRNRAA